MPVPLHGPFCSPDIEEWQRISRQGITHSSRDQVAEEAGKIFFLELHGRSQLGAGHSGRRQGVAEGETQPWEQMACLAPSPGSGGGEGAAPNKAYAALERDKLQTFSECVNQGCPIPAQVG